MFQLQKKKKAIEFVPLFQKTNDSYVDCDFADLGLVFQYFLYSFSKEPCKSVDIIGARTKRASLRRKNIPKALKAKLDGPSLWWK